MYFVTSISLSFSLYLILLFVADEVSSGGIATRYRMNQKEAALVIHVSDDEYEYLQDDDEDM